ncbi:LysM peptidoglycan-binding domain-containing protein [Cerasicoccus fimbriatus]|uniref:LysM peptidoglycan-binding domain-containing protein n=1 Tax=Cerasicoccus fimbriatus TaxID=3014554 RepID=UPI0022B34C19|nr:LysM peptidoglycan-binding domain-containing protein [Cerasicoccus sp. TK19100]
MKLAHIFTIVLGLHAVVILALFVGPGCASDKGETNAAAAQPTGEPSHAQEQPYRPANAPVRPNPTAAQSGSQTRYPPTRPDWNISDSSSPEVVVPASQTYVARDTYVAESSEPLVYEDSSVQEFNKVRSSGTPSTPDAPVTTVATPQPSSGGKTYIVKKGDVLSKIARNNGVTLGEVMAVNGFDKSSANSLKIGQVIIIPAASDDEPSAPVNAPTPTYAPVQISEEGQVYTVQSGDNLSSIAKRYNSNVRTILSANGLSSDRIFVGQELLIPKVEAAPQPEVGVPNAAGEVPYVVASGDTLGAIANRYGVSVKTIMQSNGISDPRRLRVGQTLMIPTGLEPVAPAPKPAPKPAAVVTPKPAPLAPAAPVVPAPVVPAQPQPVFVEEETNELDEIDIENAPVVNVQE